MKLTKVVVGLSTSNPLCEEAKIFPETIKLFLGIDASKEVYDQLYDKYKIYKNIKLLNKKITADTNEGISLKQLVIDHNLESIDRLYIDTEGKDIDILDTLQDRFDVLVEGQLKCQPIGIDNPNLNQNTFEECDSYLRNKGYFIHSLYHSSETEWCISFMRIQNEQENQLE